jgi:hypothetical protein
MAKEIGEEIQDKEVGVIKDKEGGEIKVKDKEVM